MKVAIIHYWFVTRRGGEKVVESLLKIYPDADIYTLFYDKNKYGNSLVNQTIYTSILNIPFLKKRYQKVFPLYPLGIKSLKLKRKYDLIISSESGPAKGIHIGNNTPHICYIHSPMRYCWSHKETYVNAVSPILRPLLSFFLNRLKNYDKSTIDNVNLYLSNSKNVANRVKKYYQKDSEVVYPPIADVLFTKPLPTDTEKDIFLSFGAITPYKRIDLLIDVFNKNGKQLVIIGDGSEKLKLEKKANKNITFKGNLAWEEIEYFFARSKALLFPGEEDFGMIPLEVMAYGIPVIAYKKGGALETIIENRNNIKESSGLFFDNQKIEAIEETIKFFEKEHQNFNPIWIRNHAKKFSEEIFISNIKKQIKKFENK
ncbi:glycosyltransferase family 4 protein [Aureibaculum algae]|uniref:Glycosyltransferase family 4 protein n=1 Tax=Aureibaculum algae TaxID=2584122 RepID=A0A5B7TP61_9FLAO|nr:glycosyltransferase [Aureibaculum algae]QCX37004.1 glycosyltransferase family 4 protein [Aureibaculum algae]